jgi:hypothetical protein
LQKVFNFIKQNVGCPSTAVMRNFRLMKRENDNILDTLVGRGMIDIRQEGKGRFLFPIGE